MKNIDEGKIKEILSRNVEDVVTREELTKKLLSGKKMRIKHGVDVTNPMLHLGHAVNYWKMREFQELGHKVIFLIGDFTTSIGDPTGKSKTRPEISPKDIIVNSKKFLEQASKILINKPGLLEVRRNSEWYGKMKPAEFLGLFKKITHAQLIERDMFQERIKKHEDIYIHEMLYPILQAYDSVMLNSDLTIIGSDQLFNELMGRKYQTIFGQDPQCIITTSITPGLDGKEKMSKSLGNFVAISDSAENKFGKIMTIPDELIKSYLGVYTKLPLPEIEKINSEKPFNAKKRLAYEIVKIYQGEKEAEKAKEYFEKTFSKKEIPEDIAIYKTGADTEWTTILIEVKAASSKSEAKRLIDGGAIDFNGIKISRANEKVGKSGTAKIGKHKFIKIEVK